MLGIAGAVRLCAGRAVRCIPMHQQMRSPLDQLWSRRRQSEQQDECDDPCAHLLRNMAGPPDLSTGAPLRTLVAPVEQLVIVGEFRALGAGCPVTRGRNMS